MSEEGGSARLQLAVALDSLSQTDEAKKLYQSLGRHPNIEIVKRANRMLWGMTTAAEFMKADKFQYNRGMRVGPGGVPPRARVCCGARFRDSHARSGPGAQRGGSEGDELGLLPAPPPSRKLTRDTSTA